MGLLDRLRHRVDESQPPVPPTQVLALDTPDVSGPPGGGFVVVDVETTGLFPGRDRIVEVAMVHTDARGRILDEWTTLINPGGPVGATRIHGITTADVRQAPTFADAVGEVTARLAGRAIVAHNAPFDLAFVEMEYARAGWTLPVAPFLCTLDASWVYLPDLSRRRLSDCCWASGIPLHDAHSALGDARATATLLRYYLDPGRPPTAEHLALPAAAAHVVWPAAPRNAVATAMRDPARPVPEPAAPGRLAALLDDLPLSAAVQSGAPPAAAYLELLADVLEDGVLTDSEASSLAALAKVYHLTRQQAEEAHRGFLLALAHKIVEDGKVTHAERDELLATTAALGFSDTIIKAILDEARATLAEQRGTACKPLPDGWPHGQPLRIGSAVAFTGCDDIQRARLESRAQAAGLRVTGSVSRQTTVLVTDGINPYTTKAIAAGQLGIRTVSPATFAELVEYIQPALAQPTVPTQTRTPSPQPDTIGPDTAFRTRRTDEDPATIRAWARQHGVAVGVRGRLPAELLAAYRAAHPTV